jgi:hypothetical protein
MPLSFGGLSTIPLWHIDAVSESGRPLHYSTKAGKSACQVAGYVISVFSDETTSQSTKPASWQVAGYVANSI